MSQFTVPCVDCKNPTDPKAIGVYHESYGWIPYRGKTGGANNLRFKRQTGNVMCANCAQQRINGVKDQDSLF